LGAVGTAVTSSVAIPLIVSKVAVIVVVPGPTAAAKPAESIVATESSELAQLTSAVISTMLLSEYVPIAVYCWVGSS
jgi:hypothetical protein